MKRVFYISILYIKATLFQPCTTKKSCKKWSPISKKNTFTKRLKILLHQYNVRSHVAHNVTDTSIWTVPHLPYSPDFAPCNFWKFSVIKKAVSGMRFESNQHAIKAVEVQGKGLSKNGLSVVFQKWQKWWTKCIALEGVILKRPSYISTNKYI